MAGLLEQLALGDVRGVDELIATLLMPLARVVLHHSANHTALGVEDGQPGSDLLREGEQVEFGTKASVVPLLGFFKER